MAKLFLFNKPFNVLSQFTDKEGRETLAYYIKIPDIYPAGRLDYDSEGLLILTDNGELQSRIADPQHKLPKTYWVQLEGMISDDAIEQLERGVLLKDGLTRPAKAKKITPPDIWQRVPPIRFRKDDATSWIELTISEGKNRQVRRMTAETGYPTLRLIRYSIGHWTINNILPGTYSSDEIHLPAKKQTRHKSAAKDAHKSNPKKHLKRKH